MSTPNPGTAKKLMLIMNPVAGRKLARKNLPEIITNFMDGDYLVTTFMTRSRGEATRFIKDFGSDFDLIVCSGGDGTLNEAVTGLMTSGLDKPLGYIPAGSTNVFADCHGLPGDVVAAAERVLNGTEHKFDVGTFNEAYFSYIAAFGAFSWLSYTTPQNKKNLLGHTAYILDGIRDLPLIKETHLIFRHDGETVEGDYIFGSVCNCDSLACTFPLPKDIISYDDGLFETILIRAPRSVAELQAIVTALRNQDYSCPYIDFFRSGRIFIENVSDLPWTIDGELAPISTEILIENKPRALRIIT